LEVQGLWITRKGNLLKEFKKEAVEYSLTSEKSVEEVARDSVSPLTT
jgi:transposase-like protein